MLSDMHTLIILVLVLLIIGALPVFPWSRGTSVQPGAPVTGGWGYAPSGLGTIVLIAVVLWLLGAF